MKRRNFVSLFCAGTLIPLLAPLLEKLPARSRFKKFLRPPGAREEVAFLDLCIGCGQCASVCPNKCITMHGLEAGLDQLATPSIIARAKGCILCMACTQVCPTDALVKLEPTEEGKKAVKMGTAFV
ncbi:MAG: ferredoxin-type protein NapG, partial [Verrucomicrobiales bacterium]